MGQTDSPSAAKPTLDSVYALMNNWRKNKSKLGANIPDDLWREIFSLETKFPRHELCKLFGLNSAQYKTKQKQLCCADEDASNKLAVPVKTEAETITLTEVQLLKDISQPTPQQSLDAKTAKSQLKQLSNLSEPLVLDRQTVIVEIHRHDGACMKIHVHTGPLKTLMNDFLSGESLPS